MLFLKNYVVNFIFSHENYLHNLQASDFVFDLLVHVCFIVCSGVGVDWEHVIDELWEKASERFPTSMRALLGSFDGDLNKVKDIIKDALTEKDSSSKNSLHHQLTGDQSISNSNRKSRVEGTIALLRTMAQQAEVAQFVNNMFPVHANTTAGNKTNMNQ